MTEYNYGGFINWCVLISLCDILSSMDVARAFQSLLHSNPQCNATHKISTEILYFTDPFFFFQWPTQDNGFCHFWFGVDFKLRLCLILNFGSPSSSKIPSFLSWISSWVLPWLLDRNIWIKSWLVPFVYFLLKVLHDVFLVKPLFEGTSSTRLRYWHAFKWPYIAPTQPFFISDTIMCLNWKHLQFYAELFHLTTNIY